MDSAKGPPRREQRPPSTPDLPNPPTSGAIPVQTETAVWTDSFTASEAGQGKAAKKPAAPKPAAAKEQTQQSAARTQEQPRAAGGNGQEAGIPLKDILYVKELVGRFGAGQLHTLIDAFAR